MTREFVVLGDITYVDWSHPSGDFVARCDACGYESRPTTHAQARARVRRHAKSAMHRKHLQRARKRQEATL